jgi:hypothetical protein
MRLSGFHLPVERLSATSLALATSCPEAFRQRYVIKERERMNVEKLVGSAFHGALADNWRWKLTKGEDLSDDACWERFQGAWDHTIETEGEPEWKDTPQRIQQNSQLMLSSYLEEVAPKVRPLATEQWFEERVPDVPVPVVGVVDLETKSLIREVKTTSQKVSKPKPQWRVQARIYQLTIPKPVEHQVVTRQVTPRIYTSSSEPGLLTPVGDPDTTVLLLQQVTAAVNDYYARYGPDGVWPATGIMHPYLCGYCSFRPGCWAWKGERDAQTD